MSDIQVTVIDETLVPVTVVDETVAPVEFLSVGPKGPKGQEVELQRTATHVQWKYDNEGSWTDLVPLEDITGPKGIQGIPGTPVELQASGTHLQWKYNTDSTWTDIVSLEDLRGPQGIQGVQGLKGDTGDQGEPGIVSGETPPTDTSVLWLDTEDEAQNAVSSTDIDLIVKITQSDYDELDPPDSRTFYIIVEE